MADTLSERLRESEGAENGGPYRIVWEADVLEAADELDRREDRLTALEQALTDCHIAVSDIVAAGLKSSKPEAD